MIALILGGAPSVFTEAKAAAELVGRRHLVVAANLAGIEWKGRLDGWATLHPNLLGEWRAGRRGSPSARYFVPAGLAGVPWAERAPDRWNGSSGLYAAQVALLEMGATAVVLCGIPMDAERGHFTGRRQWESTADYRLGFEAALREFGGRIRSMDGWTADLFGRPHATWATAVENIKPLGASRPQHLRITDMHTVKNTGKAAAKFWARDASGELVLHRLAPGESTEAEIDPDQPKFQGGDLSVKALPTVTSKPKAAPKRAGPKRKKPAPPAPPVATAA